MSELHEFYVRSSDGTTSYSIAVIFSEFGAAVKCSCPAGMKQRLCKHKVRLLGNDISILSNESQSIDLRRVLDRLMENTSLLNELQTYKEAELANKAAAESFDAARKRLERTLQGN